MQQMPEEGKLFTQVDKYWKEIMRNTVKDPKVGTQSHKPLYLKDTLSCVTLDFSNINKWQLDH